MLWIALSGMRVELPSKVSEAQKDLFCSHFCHMSLGCWLRTFSFYWSHKGFPVKRLCTPLTLILDMELLGCTEKKSLFFRQNMRFFFTGKFSIFFYSFSLCLKWFLDKSTLWWAASVQHTGSVKYCLITNEAHMFSTGFSWRKLYCYLYLNFLGVFIFQKSILN